MSPANSGPQGNTRSASNDIKLWPPIQGKPPLSSPGSVGDFGNNRGDHIHAGNDISCSIGTPLIAPCDGTIVYAATSGFAPGEGPREGGGYIQFRFDQGVGPIPDGGTIGFGHAFTSKVSAGDKVRGGDVIGGSGGTDGGPHVHFTYQKTASPGNDGTSDPREAYTYLTTHSTGQPGGTSPPGSSGQGTFTEADLFAIGRAAAISTTLQLPGLLNMAKSMFMTGAKSIYNDEPLMGFIQQLCQASLRNFQSLPNGAFFAFFPDQFGLYGHRKPYWEIDDIEIIDGGIDLNDESLATHVFVVGDTINPDGEIGLEEMAASKGVVTIFDAFTSDSMINLTGGKPSKGKKNEDHLKRQLQAVQFLKKYGVRPHYEDATFIRNSFFEIFYAFTQFQILWANQFRTTFSFTFMPELYPGGIVAFQDHGFQCYIDSVTHSFDYASGFTTQANLSAPSSIRGRNPAIAQGMVKPFVNPKKGRGNG